MLWLTINRADKGNAIPYYVRDRLIAALPRRALRPRRCARSCSPPRASGTSAPAPTSRCRSRTASRSPTARPTWSSARAINMMRARLPAADAGDPGLREAGDRRAQRHRGRRRLDARARGRPRRSRPTPPSSSRCSCAAASSPTAASRTCCRASSACTRRRSSSSSATTCSAADARALGIVNKVVPAAELAGDREGVGRAARERADQGDRLVEEAAARRVASCRAATSSKKRRCSSRSTAHDRRLGRRRRVVPRAPRRRSGRAGERRRWRPS